MILDRLLERVYLMRCQLVHGAATYGGKLNRTSLWRSATMMGHLLPAVLQVWIDRGAGEDWGTMCYPPLDTNRIGEASCTKASKGKKPDSRTKST